MNVPEALYLPYVLIEGCEEGSLDGIAVGWALG